VSILTTHKDASDAAPTTRSIGASLQVLSLDACLRDIHELLDVLVAGETRLCSLSLGYLQEDGWSQLTRRLPNVVHLRELHLTHIVKRHSSSMDFVCAMQRNGSLHEVSGTSIQRYPLPDTPLFGAEELQRIRIYCQRNRMARELLQNASLLCDDTSDGHATTLLSLLPTLFAVLIPARRTHPNSIFAGLLQVACSGNSIGPRGRNKRLGPSSNGGR
jgi:hypothetical protein